MPIPSNRHFYLYIIATIFVFLTASCIAPRYSLNEQEKKFVNKSNRLNSYAIYYDKRAIRRLKQNGTYTVEITQNGAGMTSLDTFSTKAWAITIANQVHPIMNFKEHHHFINVTIKGEASCDGKSESCYTLLYKYTIRMDINDITNAWVASSFSSRSARSAYQGR